ncbi:MAG: hypothetical protein GY928_02610 [Colwellia sp.]|nr:hypothetical protein [Colwellia sp.]
MSDVVTVNITEVEENVTVNVCEGISSVAFEEITGNATDNTSLNDELESKEDDLGNPSTDGFVLSSTIAGVRSWIAKSAGAVWGSITGNITDQTDLKNALDAKLSSTGTTSALDMNNQDVIGVKDLECSGNTLLGANLDLISTNNFARFEFRGINNGGNIAVEQYYDNNVIVGGINVQTDGGGAVRDRAKMYYYLHNGTSTINPLVIHSDSIEITGGTNLNIYGTTDHKNQDVTGVKDLECVARTTASVILNKNTLELPNILDAAINSEEFQHDFGVNTLKFHRFLLRASVSNGSWYSIRTQDSLGIDGAFGNAATIRANNTTRCFWERDPSEGTHYIGDGNKDYLIINSNDFSIYTTTDHKNQDVTNVKDLDCATIDIGNGATGSFTSNDGKTVTVTKGIITSIV